MIYPLLYSEKKNSQASDQWKFEWLRLLQLSQSSRWLLAPIIIGKFIVWDDLIDTN